MYLKYGPAVIEGVTRDSALIVRVKELLVTARTKYQEVQIVDTYDFGRALVLDGYIQSTEADEFMYHETLVHPAMVAHPSPRKVLIVGGGEGATLREVLKHPTVEEAVMVDIDGELIELSKKFLFCAACC
jgi:spermidine synthase